VPAAYTPRQTELLDELVRVIQAEGFQHLTLDALAARLHCSKSTFYFLGHSKEEVILTAIKRIFRESADAIEQRTAEVSDPAERVAAYLHGAAEGLRPGSRTFYADLAGHPRTRVIFDFNTNAAAKRIRELIAEGTATGAFRDAHAAFVSDVVAATMARIQSGEVAARTGLSIPEAYAELATLVLSGIRSEL
jgi:AcrR family transcriptional regulator